MNSFMYASPVPIANTVLTACIFLFLLLYVLTSVVIINIRRMQRMWPSIILRTSMLTSITLTYSITLNVMYIQKFVVTYNIWQHNSGHYGLYNILQTHMQLLQSIEIIDIVFQRSCSVQSLANTTPHYSVIGQTH